MQVARTLTWAWAWGSCWGGVDSILVARTLRDGG